MVLSTILSSPILSIKFSKFGERVAVGSSDGVLALLCPEEDWKQVGEIDYNDAAILTVAWSSKNLAVGRVDGSVTILETEKVFSNFFVPQAEFFQKNSVRSLSFAACGRFLGEWLKYKGYGSVL